MAITDKIATRDGVVRSIIRNHQDDPTHLCAIDATLLKQLYSNFSDCRHSQYDVYVSPGFSQNHEPPTPLNAIVDDPRASARGRLEIREKQVSPTLRQGDLVVTTQLGLFWLCQVDMDDMGGGVGATVSTLKPHKDGRDVAQMLSDVLGALAKEKGLDGRTRAPQRQSFSMER